MSDRVEFCQQQAADCAQAAERLEPGPLRDGYLAMAKEWLKIAENIERVKSGDHVPSAPIKAILPNA